MNKRDFLKTSVKAALGLVIAPELLKILPVPVAEKQRIGTGVWEQLPGKNYKQFRIVMTGFNRHDIICMDSARKSFHLAYQNEYGGLHGVPIDEATDFELVLYPDQESLTKAERKY